MSSRFSKKELKQIFDDLFTHFKREKIFYFEYKEYLEAKGYNEDDLLEIWTEAFRKSIIDVGAFPLNGKAETVFEKRRRSPKPDLII